MTSRNGYSSIKTSSYFGRYKRLIHLVLSLVSTGLIEFVKTLGNPTSWFWNQIMRFDIDLNCSFIGDRSLYFKGNKNVFSRIDQLTNSMKFSKLYSKEFRLMYFLANNPKFIRDRIPSFYLATQLAAICGGTGYIHHFVSKTDNWYFLLLSNIVIDFEINIWDDFLVLNHVVNICQDNK